MFDISNIVGAIASRTIAVVPRRKTPKWSLDEIEFLRKSAGTLSDEEMASALGRTPTGIKVFRTRRKILGVTRSATAWLTASKIAAMLGIDQHKVTYWCRVGLLKSKEYRQDVNSRIYYIASREAVKRWCVNPANWVYFDWRQIKDEKIRRLCQLRAERWGDEWWTTNQVAQYHGVENKDVVRLIDRGEIKAYRPEFSLGGRNLKDTWRNLFVLRSEATRPDLVFIKGMGRPGVSKKFSPGFDAFLLKARDELKLEWDVIGRMAKVKSKSARYRYARLKAGQK